MSTHPNASPDDIDITSLWSVLKRNARRIVGISAAMGVGTFGVLALVPSKYTSEAQIQIGGQGVSDPFRDPNVGATPTVESVAVKVDKEAIASQVVAMRSRDLAYKLATEMRLAKRAEFNSALGGDHLPGRILRMAGLAGPNSGETEEERVLNAYYKALRVFQVRDTRVITVEFTSEDSEFAAKTANRLTELYQDWLRNQGVTQTEDASQWLLPQIEKLAKDVSDAESEVVRFRSQSNIFQGAGNAGTASTGLNEQQLTDLTTEVTKARTARGEAEARARSARDLMQRGFADSISEVQKSPVIQGLIGQRTRAEREKAEADTTLLGGHPRMKQLNAQVADLRRQVNKEAMVIVEGLEKEAKALAIREEIAVKSLDEMKARIGNKAGDIAKLASLEGQAKAKRRELDGLQAKLEAAKSRRDVKSIPLEAQIISKASPSSIPSSPKRVQLAALASAAGLMLGFAVLILKELATGARRNGNPAQPAGSGGPVYAPPVATHAAAPRTARAAPVMPPLPSRVEPTLPQTQRAPAADSAIDTVARRLADNAEGQGGYRTVVTGAAPGVPARDQAIDIAVQLGAGGRQVAVIDWSLDGNGLSRGLGLEPSPGLTDLLDGRASFEDVIRRVPDSEVHVVPCGSAAQADLAADADRVNLVLDALDEAYDHIIVTGEHAAIKDLFLAIQGRFDAGVVVTDGQVRGAETGNGSFLGFQVTDIDVILLERAEATRRPRMRLARGAEGGDARA